MKKKIILGISASIAAYKCCDLIRLYTKQGYDVWPILTPSAVQLVAPLTLETLSCNPVFTEMFTRNSYTMGHIALKENAALLAIVPATADVIGKFANGIADDLLSTTYLSVSCPVLIAPAMNPAMWAHPAVKHNTAVLKERGVHFIGPDAGVVACGDEGEGRLSPIENIFNETVKIIGG